MVYLAARRLGCVHQTVYNYIQRHSSVRAAWEAENGIAGDTAELKLYQAILAGEHWAIAFYLRTKGKDRGYTERQEVAGVQERPIPIEVIKVREVVK